MTENRKLPALTSYGRVWLGKPMTLLRFATIAANLRRRP